MSVRLPHFGLPRIASLAAVTLALLPLEAESARAQWLGWEKPRPAARVHQPTRYRTERRSAAAEKPEPKKPESKKKAEAKPELPQMAFAVVSLADQRISIYGADGLITHSVVSTGQAGHRTPTGIFTILEKQRWHESNIYSGAPMPFMQRITWSGVAMHEGIVPGYPASHGCIRLPAAFAAKLFGMTKPGTRVILAAGDLQPFEFAHALLPVPRLVPAAEYAVEPAEAPRVTLASNDPEAAGASALVAAANEPAAADRPAMLSPFDVAYALKAKAAADAVRARKSAEGALALSRTASAEADVAAMELKAARADLERARAKAEAARADAAAEAARLAEAAKVTAATPDAAQPVTGTAATASAAAPAAAAPVALADEVVKAAEVRLAAAKAADDSKSQRAFDLAGAARAAEKAIDAAQDAIVEARRRQSPVNVVVSRKEGMILVRQGQKAVYEAPITIAEPEKPLGTHIFIAIEASGDAAGLDWAAMTVPTSGDDAAERKSRSGRKGKVEPVVETPRQEPSGPEEALERITMPETAKQKIAELIWVGGSLVITDRGLSNESGEHTDLNVSLP